MARKDVFEHLIDGTSGIVRGDVSGAALVVGVCSLGTPGKLYYLDKESDLAATLGAGPLVDRLNDVFARCGQDAVVLAVPVSGQAAGTIGAVVQTGGGASAQVSGVAGSNADVVVEVVDAGGLGAATYKLSLDAGQTWGETTQVPANGQIGAGETGTTLILADEALESGTTYAYSVRTAIGPVELVGDGPDISVSGTVLRGAQIEMQILRAGGLNEGQYQLSLDGGDNWSATRTLPLDADIAVGDTGTVITLADSDYELGDTYSFELLEPVPTIADVVAALATPLETVDPEFVHVCGATDSVDWAALGVLADELWGKHRPTFFTCEARLPFDGEDLNDWVTALINERDGFTHRFVAVCAGFGEITDRSAYTFTRNAGGLLVARLLSIPVMRDIGRVRDGAISGFAIPDDLRESMQEELEDAGYITPTRYAGLEGTYWGTARTMAEDTSDFQRLEVVRTTFKAVRLMRIQALKSLKDELGDPVLGNDASGLTYLRTNLGAALDTMTKATPVELVGYEITIPTGQDFVNNGVAVKTALIGVPIIGSISLYTNYAYAGGVFDPRLEG